MKRSALKDLKTLFEFAPPEKLKASITNLLLENLMRIPEKNPHKKEVYTDIYILFDFLDKMRTFVNENRR